MRALQLGILAAAVAGMATLMGCESINPMGPSLVDQHWGEAFRMNVAQQTENPNASYDNTENPQIDPDTAAVVMDRYFQKQSQPPPQQMPSIIQIDTD
jgi:type IV pilus biogenesis protein CpaD/CtpE